jgi:hypothetical protein
VAGTVFEIEDEAPYWKVCAGIARPWTPSPRGRRGCMVMLLLTSLLLLAALIVGVVALLT